MRQVDYTAAGSWTIAFYPYTYSDAAGRIGGRVHRIGYTGPVMVHREGGAPYGEATAGAVMTGGLGATGSVGMGALRTSTVVSPGRAERFLVASGMRADRARDYVNSFDGPITARIVRPGEEFLRYYDEPFAQGSFLGKQRYATPEEAVEALALGAFPNRATRVQTVTARERSIVLEGSIRDGAAGARQTLTTKQGAFTYGPGEDY